MTNDINITRIILSKRRSLLVILPGYNIDAPDALVIADTFRDAELAIVQVLPLKLIFSR